MRITNAVLLITLSALPLQAQQKPLQRPPEAHRVFSQPSEYVPDLATLVAATSELRDVVDRFSTDRNALQRFENVPGSSERRSRLRGLYQGWLARLPSMEFNRLSQEGKV